MAQEGPPGWWFPLQQGPSRTEKSLELGPKSLMKLEYIPARFASMGLLPSLKPLVLFSLHACERNGHFFLFWNFLSDLPLRGVNERASGKSGPLCWKPPQLSTLMAIPLSCVLHLEPPISAQPRVQCPPGWRCPSQGRWTMHQKVQGWMEQLSRLK